MTTDEPVEDVEITSANFKEYFHDIRTSRPQKGEIMARFWAVAEFADGPEKLEIIRLLKAGEVYQAVQMMRKIHGAVAPDCYRICREMSHDLLYMSEDEVNEKRYEFFLEYFYYTKKQYVPNNKHWEVIKLLEFDKETNTFKSTIEL